MACPACGDVTASFEDSDGVWRCWMCEARLVYSPAKSGGAA